MLLTRHSTRVQVVTNPTIPRGFRTFSSETLSLPLFFFNSVLMPRTPPLRVGLFFFLSSFY
jgi:hypothetical protein